MAPDRIVWYVADPMCSWCWGFTPVIDAIEATYRDRLTGTMAMGGLRPGTTAPMPAAQREEILHHLAGGNRLATVLSRSRKAMPRPTC
jgi:putative protein-disulfide isomerase